MYLLINLLNLGSTATTTSADTASAGLGPTFITFGLIIAIFYFLLIKPQKKRDKETKDMLASMQKGDKVVTIGGIRGTVAVVKESTVVIKVDDNTRIEFSKNAVSQILNKKDAPAVEKKDDKKAKKNEKLETVEKPVEIEEPKEETPVEAVPEATTETEEK